MAYISVFPFLRYYGVRTLLGMARKLGLNPPPPPISVRNLVDCAVRTIKPLAPVDLYPPNGATGVSDNPYLYFRDPGLGTPAAALQFSYQVLHNGAPVDAHHVGIIGGTASNPLMLPGVQWSERLPSGLITLNVDAKNKAGYGPSATSTFTVGSPSHPPPPLGNLTLRVTIASFGRQRSITLVGMFIDGPGSPESAIPFQFSQDRMTATAIIPLRSPPTTQNPVLYTVRATVTFHYDGLINPNTGTISGGEDAEVGLAAPASIPWTGQSRAATFAIRYDRFSNAFTFTFDGLV